MYSITLILSKGLCAQCVKCHHLIQFLCVFSVRKISSILGISVEHGKNVPGWQAVCRLLMALFMWLN